LTSSWESYYRARYYDAQVGRFISEDPTDFNGSGTNFYAYVRNNPVDLADPLGFCPEARGTRHNEIDVASIGGEALYGK